MLYDKYWKKLTVMVVYRVCLYCWHSNVQKGNEIEGNKIHFLCLLYVYSKILSPSPDIFSGTNSGYNLEAQWNQPL